MLRPSRTTTTIEDVFMWPGLETLEIDNAQNVTLLGLAHLLVRSPTIRSVKSPLKSINEEAIQGALLC